MEVSRTIQRDRPTGADNDEQRLIALARNGDSQAMGDLLRSYQSRVYSLCYRMVNHPDDAADLAQDVLTNMMTGLRRFDGRSALSTWVYRLALNTCISHLRRRRTMKNNGLGGGRGSGGDGDPTAARDLDLLPGREPEGSDRVQMGESRARLVRALDEIGEEYRALLVLRDVRDLEYQQIADVLGVPLGTVKSRLFRARLALRQAMERMERSKGEQSESGAHQ